MVNCALSLEFNVIKFGFVGAESATWIGKNFVIKKYTSG